MDTELIEQYISSLNDQERKTLEIAKDHLGTSFNIVKSVGFINWNETRSTKSPK
jgi:transcriptional regulator CtsR